MINEGIMENPEMTQQHLWGTIEERKGTTIAGL